MAAGAPGGHADGLPPTPTRAGSPSAGVEAELVGLLASMALAVAARGDRR